MRQLKNRLIKLSSKQGTQKSCCLVPFCVCVDAGSFCQTLWGASPLPATFWGGGETCLAIQTAAVPLCWGSQFRHPSYQRSRPRGSIGTPSAKQPSPCQPEVGSFIPNLLLPGAWSVQTLLWKYLSVQGLRARFGEQDEENHFLPFLRFAF